MRNHEVDSTRHLTRLFIAGNNCLAYAKKNPDILIMDSTYKTNRFNMLLLNIIGINNNYKNFYICIVFLQNETEEDYE
jgi:hypothetical protein